MNCEKYIPSVRLTQQDFVSTFPWGLRSDEVRIKQQERRTVDKLDADPLRPV